MEHGEREAKDLLEGLLNLVDGRPSFVRAGKVKMPSISVDFELCEGEGRSQHLQLIVDVVLAKAEHRHQVGSARSDRVRNTVSLTNLSRQDEQTSTHPSLMAILMKPSLLFNVKSAVPG